MFPFAGSSKFPLMTGTSCDMGGMIVRPSFDLKIIFMIDQIVWNVCLSDTESEEQSIANQK